MPRDLKLGQWVSEMLVIANALDSVCIWSWCFWPISWEERPKHQNPDSKCKSLLEYVKIPFAFGELEMKYKTETISSKIPPWCYSAFYVCFKFLSFLFSLPRNSFLPKCICFLLPERTAGKIINPDSVGYRRASLSKLQSSQPSKFIS